MRAAVAWTGDAIEIIDQTLLPGEERVLRLDDAGARWSTRSGGSRCAARRRSGSAARSAWCWRRPAARRRRGRARSRAARPTAVNLRWARRARAGARCARTLGGGRGAARSSTRTARRAGGSASTAAPSSRRARRAADASATPARLATAGIGHRARRRLRQGGGRRAGRGVRVRDAPAAAGRAADRVGARSDAGIPVTVLADGAAARAAGRGGDRRGDRRRRPRRRQRRRREQDRHLRARARRAARTACRSTSPAPRSTLDAAHAERRRRSRSSSATAPRCGLAARLPEGVAVWNPAFDVTPAELITAIITDAGVLRPPFEASIAGALGRPRAA